MKSTFVSIAGKLPDGLVQLYRDIDAHAKPLSLDYLVVGAMARDLVLVHGYGAEIERGTRDVDFGINVSTWADFEALKNALLNAGYHSASQKLHRLTAQGADGLPWEIDIIPFGAIAETNHCFMTFEWPSKNS